jgi:AcrR family transcriptional regulator
MGRPREFSEAEALDSAMRVFWEKGYEGTSLDDFTAAMRINRSSLYSTFGDKPTLFRRVIERYRRRAHDIYRRGFAKTECSTGR